VVQKIVMVEFSKKCKYGKHWLKISLFIRKQLKHAHAIE